MSVMTRHMKKQLEEARLQESTPPRKNISDVPPEILEMIFRKLDCGDNSLLPYRCVHPTWTNTINGILERRALKGDLVACSKVFIENDGDWPYWPIPTIRYPRTILHHPGNPFPTRSLLVTRKASDPRNYGIFPIVRPLDTFTTKFGSHLNIFELARVDLKFGALTQILSPLCNLRILKLSRTFVRFNLTLFQDDLKSFPALPHLTTLELNFLKYSIENSEVNCEELFITKITDAYEAQLVSLKLESLCSDIPLQSKRPLVDDSHFQPLQQLQVFYPTPNFFGLSCAPPLKRLSIVNVFICDNGENLFIDILMSFVDKFKDTLESLDLDIRRVLLRYNQKEIDNNGIFQTSTVLFPKLTKFTVAYPKNEVEAEVIKKTFLVKFPALKQLHFIHFRIASADADCKDDNQMPGDIISKFLAQENYSRECTALKSISVSLGGERS